MKLAFLVGRYLVISYGQAMQNQFEACLFYDVVLDRWGRVVIEHCDVFMYPYPTFASSYFYSQVPGFYVDMGDVTYADMDSSRLVALPAKRGIAFLKNTGEVDLLNTDLAQAGSAGVAIFGRIQSIRQRALTLLNVELDAVKSGAFTCTLLPSAEDGEERGAPIPMPLAYSSGQARRFESYETALNFDVAIEGPFVLNNMLVRVKNHGYR